MKVLFNVSPVMQFEIENEKPLDVFEDISKVQEVFGIVGNEQCQMCKQNTKLLYKVRENKDEDKFYEIQCPCGGKLAFSVNKGKEGTLYPVRKLKNGLPAKVTDEAPFDWSTKGWHKYDKDKHGAKEAPAKK